MQEGSLGAVFQRSALQRCSPPRLAHDGSLTAAQRVEALGDLPGEDEATEW